MTVFGMAIAAAPALADTNTSGGTTSDQQQAGQTQTQGDTATTETTGGQQYGAPNPATTVMVEGTVAKLLPDGMAADPKHAPPEGHQAILAANEIFGRPDLYRGGPNQLFWSP